MQRWELASDGAILDTRGACGAFVRKGRDRAVLKIVGQGSGEAGAAAVLAHYDGHGAVRVLDHDARAILLERATPGFALTRQVLAGADDEATHVHCAVIADLHRFDPPEGDFRTVEDWGEGFERHRRSASHSALLPEAVDKAQAIYHELCGSQEKRYLLHGDLHHDNVLYDHDRGWLTIDPKGVVGELAYETGAALRNPTEKPDLYADPAIIDRRVRIMCGRLGLDRERVLGWCFAQAVLSAIWAIEDGEGDNEIMTDVRVAKAALSFL